MDRMEKAASTVINWTHWKVLLFTKFPVGPDEEKEKVWKAIKSKINSKCRVIRKFTHNDSNERSL